MVKALDRQGTKETKKKFGEKKTRTEKNRRVYSLVDVFVCNSGTKLFISRTDISLTPLGANNVKGIFKRNKGVRISSTFSVLRPFSYLRPFLYFDSRTSTSVLRHFVKSGFLIGRESQVEVQFWSK